MVVLGYRCHFEGGWGGGEKVGGGGESEFDGDEINNIM